MSEAVFYEPYVANWRTPLLGCDLRPLTLGHLVLLNSIESTFVLGGEHTFSDLAASIFICCNEYQTALDAFRTKWLQNEMSKWQKQLGVFDFGEACLEFVAYINLWTREPKHRWSSSDSTSSGGLGTIPKVQGVKVLLMSDLGFRESELMDRPWRLCVLDWLTYHANAGSLRFVTDAEETDLKAIARMTPTELEAACKKLKEARNGTR